MSKGIFYFLFFIFDYSILKHYNIFKDQEFFFFLLEEEEEEKDKDKYLY